MQVSALVQRPLGTGRLALPSFENLAYQRTGRGRETVHYVHPPPVAVGSALLLQVPGKEPKRKRKRERGPPPPKRPNLIRNMNATKSPKGLSSFFTLSGTWHRVDWRVPFVVVGDIFFNPKTLRWEGNEQILRDFDVVVASSSRPALVTNLSCQGPPPGERTILCDDYKGGV